jgi:hypothetical protein
MNRVMKIHGPENAEKFLRKLENDLTSRADFCAMCLISYLSN